MPGSAPNSTIIVHGSTENSLLHALQPIGPYTYCSPLQLGVEEIHLLKTWFQMWTVDTTNHAPPTEHDCGPTSAINSDLQRHFSCNSVERPAYRE
ncbi:hypothetical protein ScPMuIL_001465 [Solemya velum]